MGYFAKGVLGAAGAISVCLLLCSCSQAQHEDVTTFDLKCVTPKTHKSKLTDECIENIGMQIQNNKDYFFIILLDREKNIFVQGIYDRNGSINIEVPANVNADLPEGFGNYIIKIGFNLDSQTGNYTKIVDMDSGSDPNFSQGIMQIVSNLGFSSGDEILYTVDEPPK